MNADEPIIEDLNADDAKLSQMLANLRRVDAPANFEFHLKARIAKAKRPEAAAGFLPSFVKYAAPLALIGAISSLFFLNSGGVGDDAVVKNAGVVPTVGNVAKAVIAPPVEIPSVQDDRAAVLVPRSERKPASARPAEQSGPRTAGDQSRYNRDIGVKGAQMILPNGNNTNAAPPAAVPPSGVRLPESTGAGDNTINAGTVFNMLGVNAGFEEGSGWNVRAVRLNSQAAKAGLQTGDVIEAIGETQLGKDPVLKGGVSGKAMKVRRDGKIVELTLPK